MGLYMVSLIFHIFFENLSLDTFFRQKFLWRFFCIFEFLVDFQAVYEPKVSLKMVALTFCNGFFIFWKNGLMFGHYYIWYFFRKFKFAHTFKTFLEYKQRLIFGGKL
jgi:hypothetical protein